MIVVAAFITEYPRFVIDLSVSVHISYNYDEGKEKKRYLDVVGVFHLID